MANDLNNCSFIGRLGKDPEMRSTPTGTQVANFSLAVGWKSKDKDGTEWVNIVAFGKLAEIIGQYLKKGSKIYISGGMRTRKWQDQSGADRYSVEIVAKDMIMLDSKGAESSSNNSIQKGHAVGSIMEDDFNDALPW